MPMAFKKAVANLSKKTGPNKLVLGFAALAATATIGATGIAAAQTASADMQAGYGGNTADVDLDLNVTGNNNILEIILNIF
jgi:hypothetical protein